VKRDHITSHMRVHVPLKPHKCDFCGKSFKRPQDLKKHVKTHADDSVLLRSPENNMNQQQGGNNGFVQQDNKNAYFQPHDPSNPYPPPGQGLGQNNSFVYPNPHQYSGYGQVNYPGTNMAEQQSMDTRRRAIEALNDFLGDVKRRTLDPGNYYDVGQRLNTQSLPLPVSSGNGYSLGGNGYGGNGHNSFGGSSGGIGSLLDSFNGGSNGGMNMNGGSGVHAPLAQSYALPLSNARTKGDLLDIDKFLEQLQATVYESSNQAAAAGVQQPGVHTHMPHQFNGFNNFDRNSNSPPQYQNHHSHSGASAQPLTSVAQMASMTAHAQNLDTPALTPASVSSYTSSGQSPMSSHSRSSGDGASMYPQLPSVTGMSGMGSGYSTAAPSGLASGFDGFEGRRYSGGRLQREAPARAETAVDSEAMDLDSEGGKTPRNGDAEADRKRQESSSNVDPALRSESDANTPTRSEGSEDRVQESWIENVRVIETLRTWIKERLSQGEFERDGDSTPEPADHQRHTGDNYEPDFSEAAALKQESVVDPSLDSNMDPQLEAKTETEQHEEEAIAYPTLKTET